MEQLLQPWEQMVEVLDVMVVLVAGVTGINRQRVQELQIKVMMEVAAASMVAVAVVVPEPLELLHRDLLEALEALV